MDQLFCQLEGNKIEPKDLLPAVSRWIVEKGTAQQFIDWINGLQAETKGLFHALNAVPDGEEIQTDSAEVDGEEETELRLSQPVRISGTGKEQGSYRQIPID
ncbi:AV2 protein [Sida golden yellow spot virus]|uniref:AV2 protein n=1 Tax=Sida golden yellow spot virus TaxID=1949198 RepID=A0A1S6KEE8_9GEMI|nr:AV2 protein [Sida golden yellow spot virus]AQT01548.1 AV2 protein [Sida golden yellow spot virus]